MINTVLTTLKSQQTRGYRVLSTDKDSHNYHWLLSYPSYRLHKKGSLSRRQPQTNVWEPTRLPPLLQGSRRSFPSSVSSSVHLNVFHYPLRKLYASNFSSSHFVFFFPLALLQMVSPVAVTGLSWSTSSNSKKQAIKLLLGLLNPAGRSQQRTFVFITTIPPFTQKPAVEFMLWRKSSFV